MQTRVCQNSYTGTRTVPDLYSCLCERNLTLWHIFIVLGYLVCMLVLTDLLEHKYCEILKLDMDYSKLLLFYVLKIL